MAKIVVCLSCGAEFDDEEIKCPYCGTLNYHGAEKDYLNKLEDVRDTMEDLEEVGGEEVKQELKKQGKFIKKVILIAVIVAAVLGGLVFAMNKADERDTKADYIWEQTTFPKWDELYENRDYNGILDAYYDAVENDKPYWNWDHFDFLDMLRELSDIGYYLDEEKEEGTLTLRQCQNLFYAECKAVGVEYKEGLTEEDRDTLAPYIDEAVADYNSRWDLSEEQKEEFLAQMKNHHGYLPYDISDKYVEEWYKE